jgi:hypothetical protein
MISLSGDTLKTTAFAYGSFAVCFRPDSAYPLFILPIAFKEFKYGADGRSRFVNSLY